MTDYSIYLEELALTIELQGPVWGMYALKSGVSAGAMIERVAQEFRQIRAAFGALPARDDIVHLSDGHRFAVTHREFMHRKGARTLRFILEMRGSSKHEG